MPFTLDEDWALMNDDEKLRFLKIDSHGLESMKPSLWRDHPQHITKVFDNVTISSRFDSGNLENVT